MKDLTIGSPMKVIVSFSVPVLLGLFVQQLYNVVDAAIIGRILGGTAFAGVGSTHNLYFIVINCVVGMCAGFSVPISKCFGAGDYDDMRNYWYNCTRCCIVISGFLTIAAFMSTPLVLTLMQTPYAIFDDAQMYIATIFLGIPAYILYNITASTLRALGDSKTPVLWAAISSVTNIGLDLLFIVILRMGVMGAALATVVSVFVSGVGCLFRLRKGFDVLCITETDRRISVARIRELLRLGAPMGLQYSITGIGGVVIQSSINALGTAHVLAVAAGTKVHNVLACPFVAMGTAMVSYSGQNMGANKYGRVHSGVCVCNLLGAAYALFAFLLVMWQGPRLVSLFIEANYKHLIPVSMQWLSVTVVHYILLCFVNVFRNTVQGMGYSLLGTISGVIEMVARVFMAHSATTFGFYSICNAFPVAWWFAGAYLIVVYIWCLHKERKVST